MFGRPSRKSELEATIQNLNDRIRSLESERDSLSRRLEKEEKRARMAGSDLKECETLLKKAREKITYLEGELERLEGASKNDKAYRETFTLTEQASLDLLYKIGSIKSRKEDLLTIYLKPQETITDLEHAERIPPLGDELEHLVNKPESDTGIAIFRDTGRITLNTFIAIPAFPFEASSWIISDAFDTRPLDELIQKERFFCVLLPHAGETFIGIFNQDDLIEERIVTSSVKEKHSKGGWSQKRFSRLREEDVKKHIKKVADTLGEMMKQWGDTIEFIIVGGEYNLVKEVLADYSEIPTLVRGIDARIGRDRESIEEVRAKALSLKWYVIR